MITDSMQLISYSDARVWAENMGDFSQSQQERIADWIWENKPAPGCDWLEFQAANGAVLESDEFWDIAGDE